MKELKDIVQAYEKAVREGKQTALATVVKVEGSSYRRPGARMLVTEDGEITGAVSGGCLEGDALRKARLAILQQQARLVVYDTTDEDDLKFGVQLGCNGIVSILFEPIEKEGINNPIRLLHKLVAQRGEAMLVTAFGKGADARHSGTCGYTTADGAEWFMDSPVLKAEAQRCLYEKMSTVVQYPDGLVLYQFVSSVVQLVVAGAGNDAQPLVAMASLLGWKIIVLDGRSTHALPRRFPGAAHVAVSKPADVLTHVEADEQTAFVLMTHNYHYDLALLEQLMPAKSKYIGLLGPKKKLQRMLQELSAKGMAPTENQLARVHGPAGLDIGAEGAEEIALSIIAEIKACFAERPGTPLKFRQGDIYERT